MESSARCIAFAVTSLVGGGAERAVVQLANNCHTHGYQAILIVAEKKGPFLKDVAPQVKLVDLDTPLKPVNTLRFATRLKEALREWKPEAIISHLSYMNRMILRVRRLGAFDLPVMVVEQNNVTEWLTSRGRSRLTNLLIRREMRWLYRSAEHIVGVSHGVADTIVKELGLPRERVRVIHNPVDVDQVAADSLTVSSDPFAGAFSGLPRPIIMAAGRLHLQKGFDDLIEAFAALPDFLRGSLVIAGEGELATELRNLAHERGVADRVHFSGFLDNPWWFMRQSDIFAISSRWEGFPLILLEAMAAGAVIVSTDCPYGPADLIRDGENGRLVPVGDIPGLSRAIKEVLGDEKLKECWRQRGMSAVESFRPDRIVENYLALLAPIEKDSPLC